MRVDEVSIENFRGIREMRMPLDPRVNLFVGVNGSGKSTLLDCVAIVLSKLDEQLRGTPFAQQRHISAKDISLEAPHAAVTLAVSHEEHRSISWWEGVERSGRTSIVQRSATSTFAPLVGSIQRALAAESGASIPIIVHYPVNRAVLQGWRHSAEKHDFEQLSALDEPTSEALDSFNIFFDWFAYREDIENERFREKYAENAADADWRDRQLGAVRAAIPKFLDGFHDLRIRRVPAPMRMMVTKGAEELALDQLSDGEKCTLALVGDLARRLAIANPTLSDPLQGSGIVLIDEVDLHLHPRWQRMIVPTLRDTFPGCQFLLTTHSPQVIGHVPAHCVRTLRKEGNSIVWAQPEGSYGMDSNRVLAEIMGSDERPHEIKARLEALFTLIGRGDLTGAKAAVEALRAQIEGDEPELVKAEAVIRRKELIGR